MAKSQKLPEALEKVVTMSDHIVNAAGTHGPLGGRRPTRTVGVSAIVLVVLYMAARFLLELTTLSTGVRVAVALLPAVAFVWLLWTFIRELTQADELERRIQLEALALAFPLTLILVMTLGLLQLAVPLPPEDWSYRHIWPMIYVFYLLGLVRARRQYA